MNLQQQLMQTISQDHWGFTDVHFVFFFFGVFLVKLGVCTANKTA